MSTSAEAGARRSFGVWVVLSVQLLGLWWLGGLGWDLAAAGSRASHTLAGLRWPMLGWVVVCGVIVVLGVGQALRSKRVPLRALREGFTLFVACMAVQVLMSPRYKPELFALAFGSGVAGFTLLRLLEARGDGWREMRVVRLLELVAFQAALLLLVAELTLRGVGAWIDSPMFLRDDQGVQAAIDTYRFEKGQLRMGFPVSDGGHYDDLSQSGEFRVVAIGDSFSQGIVPHRYHFTTECERLLRGVVVHNLGHAGTGPGAYLQVLEEEGLALAPDLVLINVFVGNDLAEAMRWRARGWIESFCDRRNVLTYLVPQRLFRAVAEGMKDRGEGGGILAGPGDTFDMKTTDAKKLTARMPWLADWRQEPPSISRDEFLRIERKRAREIHLADRMGSYDQVCRILTEIQRRVGDVPLAVMLIPDEFQIEDALWAKVAGPDYDREQPQARIREWLAQRSIPCLDLLPVLRAEPLEADGNRHLYHLRDTHLNARGNRVVGRALAEFLRQQRK